MDIITNKKLYIEYLSIFDILKFVCKQFLRNLVLYFQIFFLETNFLSFINQQKKLSNFNLQNTLKIDVFRKYYYKLYIVKIQVY